MVRGRKPTPTAVKELRGNPGRRPLNENEPKGQRLSGRAPRGLSEGAARFWHKYVPRLVAMGVPVEVDEPALMLMAEHFSLALEARAILEDDGLVTEDEKGLPRKHPLLQVFRDQSAAFRGYAAEFGMTPSSRSKVKLEAEDQLSMADVLFARASQAVETAAGTDPLDEFRDE